MYLKQIHSLSRNVCGIKAHHWLRMYGKLAGPGKRLVSHDNFSVLKNHSTVLSCGVSTGKVSDQ